MNLGYIGRLAPSPTGLLHLGHVRTFAVASQRAAGRVLRLRIDDLDRARSRPVYMAALLEDLQWLGLEWTGVPVFQNERTDRYREAWRRLVLAGWLYPCQCSRRDFAEIAGAPHEAGGEVMYPGTCRPSAAPSAEVCEQWAARGLDGITWRFRVLSGERAEWEDGRAGWQRFTAGHDFGDFRVWRRDGTAAYQLATVVDDIDMAVTEVVRGADLLLSTARQILLFHALGAVAPGFWHVPLIVDAHGQRLAKRTDALSVRAMRDGGWTREQVLRSAKEELPAQGAGHSLNFP